MGLAGYKPEVREFPLMGGATSFTVRGISLKDIAVLIRTHLSDMEALIDLFTKGGKLEDADLMNVATNIAAQAPGFAANVIALAAGEEDATNAAEALPFPLQVEVLLAIGDLTFREVGGPKKALEAVARLLTMTTGMDGKTLFKKMQMKVR